MLNSQENVRSSSLSNYAYVSPNEHNLPFHYEHQHGEFTRLGKRKIGGFKMEEIDSIDKYINLIHPSDVDMVFNFSKTLIEHVNDLGAKIFQHQSKNVFRIIGKGGQHYAIQRHGIVTGVVNNQFACNISFLEDVSWLSPRIGVWQAIGPGMESYDFEIPEIANFKNALTPREIEILKYIARGFQSRDIARFLNISRHTVDTHRRNMIKKLEATNSVELVNLSRDMGII